MNAYLPIIIEISVLVILFFMASALTTPLRRRLGGEGMRSKRVVTVVLDLLAHVSRPLVVLVLTELVVYVLKWTTLDGGWVEDNDTHLRAWRMFWLGVAAINLVDGAAQAAFRWRNEIFPIPDLLKDIIRAALVVAMGFVVLRVELGIDIGPLLASTALLTAVVGFALQGVLGNLMSGMSLHLVGSLQPGAWIEVDGIEGRVMNTNWRETRLRTRRGHMYTIPNGKIAESRICNMDKPTPLRGHIVEVGASYSDAPDEVIAALVEAARGVPDVRLSPAPWATVTAYLDFGINYQLQFWTTDYPRHVHIDGEVKRNIWYQFKRHGIEIPFPMSDKLLNDFMAVVYNQRKLPPTEVDNASTTRDLWYSDLCQKLVVDEAGEPLMTRETVERIAPLVKRLPYTHGETLCRQDEDDERFWVLAKGELSGKIDKDGKTAVEFKLPPGCVVGEMSALTGMPRSATIQVSESAELLEFGPEAFVALLSLHDDIPARLSALAAERTAENKAALEELAKQRENGESIELEEAGIFKRLMRLVKRG